MNLLAARYCNHQVPGTDRGQHSQVKMFRHWVGSDAGTGTGFGATTLGHCFEYHNTNIIIGENTLKAALKLNNI